jgi:pimeloyl-ACP methyl ester carboxylesterase
LRPRLALLALALAALLAPGDAWAAKAVRHGPITIWTVHYRAHNGRKRNAYVVLPSWYGPRNHPPIPLVISPHGRGLTGKSNVRMWGTLPARGGFAVVSPDGEGRVFDRYSWGAPGQVEDLAKMPRIVSLTLPWVRVAHTKVYAFGGSMGGQETLLLLARHPKLLAGAAVFDAVSNFALQYRAFPKLRCNRACRRIWHGPIGPALQSMARQEIGGSPKKAPRAWAARSPITYVRQIARSCVPLQLWWSDHDRIVLDQRRQTGLLYDEILRLNPDAPVQGFNGFWRHSAEMHADARLPLALSSFGLLPDSDPKLARAMVVDPAPQTSPWCADFRQTG